jgi:hypothetical protein
MTLSFSPDDEKVAGTTADGKLLVYELISTCGCHGCHLSCPYHP